MFSTPEQRKKIAAEAAAKKKAAADRQSKINKSNLTSIKKPIADKTYVKAPVIKKTAAEKTKENLQSMKNKMKEVLKSPTSIDSYKGVRGYTKGNITVYQTKKKK